MFRSGVAAAISLAFVSANGALAQEIPEKLHEQCLQAADYMGCVKANLNPAKLQPASIDRFGLPIPQGAVANVRRDGTISYFFPASVQGVMTKGTYGRYLTWKYSYHYNQAARNGYWTGGSISCSSVGTIKNCRIVGRTYVPGYSGGPRTMSWQVIGDCVDYTAKWINNRESWQQLSGGRSFESEKLEEAREILNSACPRLKDLPPSGTSI